MDPFVAEIRIFPFNFPPTGWAFCDGQLLPISQNTALFSLLGTTYGGDGRSNFALPDIQGRAVMHPGQGPGLSLHDLGESAGEETVTLLAVETPAHSHAVGANADDADLAVPANTRSLATSQGGFILRAGGESHSAVRPGAQPDRWQPTAQQPPALPDAQLLHRPSRRIPAAHLAGDDDAPKRLPQGGGSRVRRNGAWTCAPVGGHERGVEDRVFGRQAVPERRQRSSLDEPRRREDLGGSQRPRTRLLGDTPDGGSK